MPLLVDEQDPVRVTIKRDADVGARFAHLVDQRGRRRGANILVDIEAVWLVAHGDDFSAQFPQRLRRHLVGGAIGAIEHDAHAFEREVARQRPLGKFDIAGMHALDALGAPEIARARQARRQIRTDKRLDLGFHIVRKLEPVGTEQLDAVVLVQVVRGRDHHAKVRAHGAGEHGDRWRGNGAEQQHIHANRGKACHHRIFDHVARQARVLADDHAMAMVATLEHEASRLADLEREFGRNDAIRATANSICPEQLPLHGTHPALERPLRIPTIAWERAWPHHHFAGGSRFPVHCQFLRFRASVAERGRNIAPDPAGG